MFVDERSGGIAKHLGLLYAAADRRADGAAPITEPCHARAACARVRAAIACTDAWPGSVETATIAGLYAHAAGRTRLRPARRIGFAPA